MTYPFRFTDVAEPSLEYGAARQWRGLAVRRLRASPGRHTGGVFDEHRLLFYLAEGVAAECACEGVKQRRLQIPGDFDVVPAGADGSWEDQAPVDMVSVRLSPELLQASAEGLEIPGAARALAPRLGARDPLVEHLVRTLIAELDSPEHAGRLHADSLASALATRLLQDLAPVAPRRQILSKPQLRRLVEYVDTRLDADLSLDELAQVAGISVPHLTTLFRRTMGQSVHSYVMERRVIRARELLLAGGTGIAEAALETGFAHQSHLARWMRRLLGVTPGQLLRA
ncbi:AraC family transcriptional regulator [Phenylobacterium sp. J426]|uniref:helix-turn-helix transcriptional regulator n=1 Tax=Phenylobacterium sp. J426 TaxID=2898439 RepID=UPI0021511938|nr:AraC family transcriptional regulator [Phenylobacterium sp. J426]MCR5874586.1 AraC family transcriptional regulator [Phenylobacterium sp. J426]